MNCSKEFMEMLTRVNRASGTKSVIINIDCSVTKYDPNENLKENSVLNFISQASSARKIMFESHISQISNIDKYDEQVC